MLSQTHLSDAIRRNGWRGSDGARRFSGRSVADSRRRREPARSSPDRRDPPGADCRRPDPRPRGPRGARPRARDGRLRRRRRRPPPGLGRRLPPSRPDPRPEPRPAGPALHRHRKRGARGRRDEGRFRRLRPEAPPPLPPPRPGDPLRARGVDPPPHRPRIRDPLSDALRGRARRLVPRHALGTGPRRQSRPAPPAGLPVAREPHGRQHARGLRRPESAPRVSREARARGRGPRHGAPVEALRRPDHHGAQGRAPGARSVGAASPLRGRRRGHHRAEARPTGAAGIQPVPAGDHLRRRRRHRRLRPRPAADHLEPVHGADDGPARRPGPRPAAARHLPLPAGAGHRPPPRARPRRRHRLLPRRPVHDPPDGQLRLAHRDVRPPPRRGRADRRGDRHRPRRHRAPPRRAGAARERGAFPPHGRRGARHDLDRRRAGPDDLLQQALARLHGPRARAGAGARLAREHPPRRPAAVRRGVRGRARRPALVPDRLPAAPPRRRVPLGPRNGDAPLDRLGRVRGLHRVRHRHLRAPGGRGRRARERGTVPVHGRRRARDDLARRRGRPLHLLQQALARFHRSPAPRRARLRLARRGSSRGSRGGS